MAKSRKFRISAISLRELSEFLSQAKVDMGCRPHALKQKDRFEVVVIAELSEYERLIRNRTAEIHIEDLGDLPEPVTRLRMMNSGNRFDSGEVPTGFGIKE